ncbi:MAG: tRNA (adenosine(37)-N6)-dimethylallyltransferase MiaA [Pirellulales bacterium]
MAAAVSLPDDCWFLTGPTASGKSAVALALAPLVSAEIVSLDSMALYRGMDIGTAKPTDAERAAVPHHLLDILEPDQEFSLAQYVDAAHAAAADIRARGRTPLFVGGTPLYLKALLRGIFAGPPANWELRERWRQFGLGHGDEALHARLAEVDPATARRLHARDTRRIIRALEVKETTGQSITELQQQFDRARCPTECRVFALEWPRAELVARIDARVDAMFAAGLIDEVRVLLARPQPLSRTASQAVGYREVIDHVRGVRDLPATVHLVKLRTRQMAKRQMTWFRSLSECRGVAMTEPLEPGQVAQQIFKTCRSVAQ